MEPLMRLVVPDMDGGLFRPLFQSAADGIGNFTVRSGFDFLLSPHAILAANQTDADGLALNATYGLNATFADVGRPLLLWFYDRLHSQIPLFAVTSLLWLGLLASLISAHLCMRRVRWPTGVGISQERRLKPMFGLLTAVLLLMVVGCTMTILHWAGRTRFSGMSELHDGASPERNTSTQDRTHLTATFRRAIDEFDRFIEQSIVDTNTTVLSVCKEELPNVLQVLETVATDLLDRLAMDFKLAPLLRSFDEFIDLIKLLVESMRVVKDSRQDVVSPLSEFATLIDSARRDIAKQVSDACRSAGLSPTAPPADLCHRIGSDLTRLAVGVDYRQLDSDSSVTIVTLLEKMLKLNFTQVEDQVKGAKGQLYGSLDLVKSEVKKLFNQLTLAVSTQFENVLVDAELFRSDLRGAKQDPGFLVAMEAIDRAVLILDVTMAIGNFVFLVIFFLALFVYIRYMLSLRGKHSTNGRSSSDENGTEAVDRHHYIPVSSLPEQTESSEPARKSSQNGNTRASLLGTDQEPARKSSQNGNTRASQLGPDTLALPRARRPSLAVGPRDWHATCLLASCLLVLVALIYASGVFYAGAEAHMDACRYLTTGPGIAKVDQFAHSLFKDKLWPQIETLINREIKIPMGISSDQIPRQLFGPIMDLCGNDSATIFQVLRLGGLVNVSRVLHSEAVAAELAKGSAVIQDLVRNLDTNNLIPADVDDLLQKTLPSFAAVIDAENFGPSIRELGKPLLLLVGSQWSDGLRGDLTQLEASLLHRDPADRRAVLIRYLADQASALIAQGNVSLTARLPHLLGHYVTLQTNRRLTNLTAVLTASAMALKAAMSDKQFLLTSIGVRYNETLDRHMTTVASLITGILGRLQGRVGRCRPLRDVFLIPVGWCDSQVEPLSSTGVYMMVSCLAFYILVLLLLAFLHLAKRQTDA